MLSAGKYQIIVIFHFYVFIFFKFCLIRIYFVCAYLEDKIRLALFWQLHPKGFSTTSLYSRSIITEYTILMMLIQLQRNYLTFMFFISIKLFRKDFKVSKYFFKCFLHFLFQLSIPVGGIGLLLCNDNIYCD